MNAPTPKDIDIAYEHGRWLRRQQTVNSERMLSDLSYEVERLRAELATCRAKLDPKTLISAHQYLYYVLSRPVLSDREYDALCEFHGIQGGGGSDCVDHYTPEARALAKVLLN